MACCFRGSLCASRGCLCTNADSNHAITELARRRLGCADTEMLLALALREGRSRERGVRREWLRSLLLRRG